MQLTEPFVLFVTSHVWFAAQPHWGASPHALLGGTVVHEPGVPLLPDELPVPLLLPDEPLLVPDEPLLVPLEPPLLPPEELLDSSPPLLDSSPPLLDSSPPLLDSSSPLDERFGGTVTLSSGSVGSADAFGSTKSVAVASELDPSAQAASAARVPSRRTEATEWMGFIGARAF